MASANDPNTPIAGRYETDLAKECHYNAELGRGLLLSLQKLQPRCSCSIQGAEEVNEMLQRLAIGEKFENSTEAQTEQYYDSIMARVDFRINELKKESNELFKIEESDDFWRKLEFKLISEIKELNEEKVLRKCQEHITQEYSRLLTGLAFVEDRKGLHENYLENLRKILRLDPRTITSLIQCDLFHLNSEGGFEETGDVARKLSKSHNGEVIRIAFIADVASTYNYLGPKYSDRCLNYFWMACELLIGFINKMPESGQIEGKFNCQMRILYCNIAFGYVCCAQRLEENFFQREEGNQILKPPEVISVFNKCKILLRGLCSYFDDVQPFITSGWILWSRFPHSFQKNLTQYVKGHTQNWEFEVCQEELYESRGSCINSGPGKKPRTPLNSRDLTSESVAEALQKCLSYDHYSLTQIAKQMRNFQFSFKKLGFKTETSNLSKEIAEMAKMALLGPYKEELIREEKDNLLDCEILYLLAYQKQRTKITLDGLVYIYVLSCTLIHPGFSCKGRRSNINCDQMRKMLLMKRPMEIKEVIFAEFRPCNNCIFLSRALELIEENPDEISDAPLVRAHYSMILFRMYAQRTNNSDQVTISQPEAVQKIEDCFQRQMNDKSNFPQDKYCMLDQHATIHYFLGNSHYRFAILNYLKGWSMLIEYKYKNIPSILNQVKQFIYEALENLKKDEDPFRIANISYVLQHNIRDYGYSKGKTNVDANYDPMIKTKIDSVIQDLKREWKME